MWIKNDNNKTFYDTGICDSPCISSSECRESLCDSNLGICLEKVKTPLPQNCCRDDDDCANEVDNNPCFLAECNSSSSTCEFTQLCSASLYENPIYCVNESDCNDFNSCTTERCIRNQCITGNTPSISDPNCCQLDRDCPTIECKRAFCSSSSFRCSYTTIAGCVVSNGLSELYDNNDEELSSLEENSPSSEEEEEEDPGAGDIIGAIIGFVILGALVIAFIIVVLLMIVQKIIRRITVDR